MEYKNYNFHAFNLYTVKTDRFKNCHLEIVFRNKAKKEEIMFRKFLIELLTFNTKKYKSQKELKIHLEDLYDTVLYSLLSRVGSCFFTTYCIDFLNPKYCEEGYLDEVLNLAIESLYNPNVENNQFDEQSFNIIKNNILTEIQSSKENIKGSAYRRLFELMDENSYLSYNMLGTKEDVEKVTPKNLYEFYQKMLNSDYCDIYIIGNLDMDYVASYFEKYFQQRIIKTEELSLYYKVQPRKKINVVKEQKNIAQGNLLVGCNIINSTEENRDIIAYLYNFILGAGSLDTKLGTYLRQDNSLCYTVNSIYQKYDSSIIIYAGIDPNNYEKALKLIKKSLKEMTINITDEELENAKKSLSTSLNMIIDNPSSIINNYLFRNVANLKTVEERLEQLKNITVDQIKTYAKNVKINTVYMVSGVE